MLTVRMTAFSKSFAEGAYVKSGRSDAIVRDVRNKVFNLPLTINYYAGRGESGAAGTGIVRIEMEKGKEEELEETQAVKHEARGGHSG